MRNGFALPHLQPSSGYDNALVGVNALNRVLQYMGTIEFRNNNQSMIISRACNTRADGLAKRSQQGNISMTCLLVTEILVQFSWH
jgi:hypothetical protein